MQETDPIIQKLELYGGDHGAEQDMDPVGISRIVKITICHAWTIDAITVSFERYGTTQCTSKWGGGGGQVNEVRAFCSFSNRWHFQFLSFLYISAQMF